MVIGEVFLTVNWPLLLFSVTTNVLWYILEPLFVFRALLLTYLFFAGNVVHTCTSEHLEP